MANKLSLFAFLSIHISLTHIWVANGHTISWICAQTPNPQTCHSLYNMEAQANLDVENVFTFRDIAIWATLAQAKNAHKHISTMDVSSFNELEKSAWADCLELYQDTISELNRSTESRNPYDSQTWLSAAIANGETCKNGFLDFNLSLSILKSFQLNDFSKFLSNSLAINKVTTPYSSSLYTTKKARGRRLLADGFPGWLRTADRKLLQSSPKADIVVAQDGSGNYKTISEALAALVKLRKGNNKRRLVIYVKRGVYKETVEIKRSMKNLMFIGDGIGATVVTSNKNAQDGTTTFRSTTFAVSGEGFIARGMTFQNTAGPSKQQAVALRCSADFSVFYACSFEGYQDTLYVHSHRQFYRDSHIYGTIDFIFGDAVTVLQNCNIYIRKPLTGQNNIVTAQSRKDPNENTGIVIHDCLIMASPDLMPVMGSFKSYLGRPWTAYSRTLVMKSTLDQVIDPAGWLPWNGNFGLNTLYYGEYMNKGTGASTVHRVNWPGYHVMRANEAVEFSVGNFLAGGSWLPGTGVPFTSGL